MAQMDEFGVKNWTKEKLEYVFFGSAKQNTIDYSDVSHNCKIFIEFTLNRNILTIKVILFIWELTNNKNTKFQIEFI